MQTMSIGDVSAAMGISTRTLRYYEKMGLIESQRNASNAYRSYDSKAIARLKQILVLRAFRLPLKQILSIVGDGDVTDALSVLTQHAQAVAHEMRSLSMIQTALSACIEQLTQTGKLIDPPTLPSHGDLQGLMRALSLPITPFEEEPPMSKLTDVRILYLPPATVCSAHVVGPTAEHETGTMIDAFITDRGLKTIKPDFRVYGFNHPNGEKPDMSDHGYEIWVTILDDMDVPAPLVKKQFVGGLYAAHMIPLGAFEEWGLIVDWVEKSDEYDARWGDPECMAGLMEEHLNYMHMSDVPQPMKDAQMQLDLLVPVTRRG